MASEPIERLELPRLDWHDSEGRINKDALIENFNAIEAKINELAQVSAFEISAPDFTSFNYDDVTLASDDNKIVNLKSFVDILHLKGFPIVCTFADKKLKKLQYYNDNYQLITITDVNLSELGTSGKIWVYLDYSEDIVYISADATNPNDDVLIACYDDGVVYSTGIMGLIDVNILSVCACMNKKTKTYGSLQEVVNNGYTATNNGRVIGFGVRESRGDNSYNITFRDFGV